MNNSIETIKEAIDAWGLGYAIQTGSLSKDDVEDEQLSQLIETARVAMKEIERMVGY